MSKKNESIMILIATHKQFDSFTDEKIYMPIFLGNTDEEGQEYLSDNTEDNISNLNLLYSELTGFYWGWKNLSYDYLGLVHYRRYFAERNHFKFWRRDDQAMTEKKIRSLLSYYDMIVPKKRNYYIESLKSHYENTLNKEHLSTTREIIKEMYPEYLESFDTALNRTSGHMFNMFITSKKYVEKYFNWLFPILSELTNRTDYSAYSDFEKRFVGRISELLFNVWLEHEQLKIYENRVVFLGGDLSYKKIKSFLMAKIFGKKYEESF